MCALANEKIGVVGLGYVGLPLAVAFSKKLEVTGFDNNPERVEALQQGKDRIHAVDVADLSSPNLTFTSELKDLAACTCIIIAVPTPITSAYEPDLSFVERSSDLFSMLTGLLASEKNVGRMRNIYTYSLTENKYIEVKIQDMIRASGIVPSSYSSSGNSDTREYRALVDEYKAKGTSARSKFYPDEKEHPSGQMNHANQREAPMFLAWEPKGDKNSLHGGLLCHRASLMGRPSDP